MQYLLMCYLDEKPWEERSAPLQPTSTTTAVREKNGRRVSTDGPFAETKEQLGDSCLVEYTDREEAMAIAGRLPTLRAGVIAGRPVAWTFQQ